MFHVEQSKFKIMAGLAQLGMELAGGLANFGLSQWGADLQQERTKELMQIQQGMQKEMFDYTYKTAADKKKEFQDAGLSTGLMYGGATGMGGGTTGGGTQQGAGAAFQGMELGQILLQSKLMEAEVKLKEAEAKKAEEEAETESQLRGEKDSLLYEQGRSAWLDNAIKMFQWDVHNLGYEEHWHHQFGEISLHKDSLMAQTMEADIAKKLTEQTKNLSESEKAAAEKAYTEEKTRGYFQELINQSIIAKATKSQAEAAKVKAAAEKMAKEWETGEFTNWKTWYDMGFDIASEIKDLIPTTRITKYQKNVSVSKNNEK